MVYVMQSTYVGENMCHNLACVTPQRCKKCTAHLTLRIYRERILLSRLAILPFNLTEQDRQSKTALHTCTAMTKVAGPHNHEHRYGAVQQEDSRKEQIFNYMDSIGLGPHSCQSRKRPEI